MESTTLPTLLLGGDPRRPGRGVRQLGEGARPAVGARPHRRPHAALPRRRRRQLRGRDRRVVDGEVTHAQQALHPRAQRRLRRTPSTSRRSPPGGPNPACRWWNSTARAERGAAHRRHRGDDPAAGRRRIRRVRARTRSNWPRAHRCSTGLPTWSTSASTRPTRLPAKAGSRSAAPAPSARSRTAASRPPMSRSSCAAPATAAARCTTSAPQGVFEADSLIACEVITPGGNWSSYPAHKHDENTPDRDGARGDLLLRDRSADPTDHAGSATTACTARPDRPIEVLEEVRTGDVVLVPHGFHGPSVAAPGYHMYYLNVMAGPGAERAWKIVDDPEHAWLRGTWERPGRRPASAPAHHRGA